MRMTKSESKDDNCADWLEQEDRRKLYACGEGVKWIQFVPHRQHSLLFIFLFLLFFNLGYSKSVFMGLNCFTISNKFLTKK